MKSDHCETLSILEFSWKVVKLTSLERKWEKIFPGKLSLNIKAVKVKDNTQHLSLCLWLMLCIRSFPRFSMLFCVLVPCTNHNRSNGILSSLASRQLSHFVKNKNNLTARLLIKPDFIPSMIHLSTQMIRWSFQNLSRKQPAVNSEGKFVYYLLFLFFLTIIVK